MFSVLYLVIRTHTAVHTYTTTGARAAQRADADKFTAMRKAQREADKARGKAKSRHMTEVCM